jgi:lipoprotein signal peptidase
VVDFLDVYFTFIKVEGDRPYHWPTFNVADIWICVGVGLMAVDMLTHRPAKPKTRLERVAVKPDKPAEQEQG